MANKNKPPTALLLNTDEIASAKALTLFRSTDVIRSNKFSQYHPDILRALLPKAQYTFAEAEGIVKQYFNKGGK